MERVGAHRKPANPPDYSWHPVKRRNNTGSLRIPSRLAYRTRPVRQYRADATLSRLLPPRPDDPRPRLPPASPRRYDSEETAVSHPRPGAPAPRGAQHGTIRDHAGSSCRVDLVVRTPYRGPRASTITAPIARYGRVAAAASADLVEITSHHSKIAARYYTACSQLYPPLQGEQRDKRFTYRSVARYRLFRLWDQRGVWLVEVDESINIAAVECLLPRLVNLSWIVHRHLQLLQ